MPQSSAPKAAPPRLRRAGSLCVAAALLGALSGGCALQRGVFPPDEALGAGVDSVTVRTGTPPAAVTLGAADRSLFRDALEEALKARPGLHTFAQPPTTQPNSALLEATFSQYAVREQPGDGLYLRTVDLTADVSVTLGGEKTPTLRASREISYQIAYSPEQTLPTPDFDFARAARELAGQIAEYLAPTEPATFELEWARERATRKDWSHPLLVRGNYYAGLGRAADAIGAWRLVLFEPEFNGYSREIRPHVYRVSERGLAQLAALGMTPEQVEQLRPLLQERGMNLIPFRDAVRKRLGPDSPLEPAAIQNADMGPDIVHFNLAATHLNLARAHLLTHRYDVASYHLTRAYAHDPRPETLQAWSSLQTARGLAPNGMPAERLMRLYQRIPPPRTARVLPGLYERLVTPPPAFPEGPALAVQAAGEARPAPAGAPQPGAAR